MIQVTFNAMGTGVEAWCPDEAAAAGLRAWFEAVEATCSRFRPDSELSRVNRAPGAEVVISQPFADVMRAADRARRLTGGLVDAGVGAAVARWGYDRSFEMVRGLDQVPSTIPAPQWELLPGICSALRTPASTWEALPRAGPVIVLSSSAWPGSYPPAAISEASTRTPRFR